MLGDATTLEGAETNFDMISDSAVASPLPVENSPQPSPNILRKDTEMAGLVCVCVCVCAFGYVVCVRYNSRKDV